MNYPPGVTPGMIPGWRKEDVEADMERRLGVLIEIDQPPPSLLRDLAVGMVVLAVAVVVLALVGGAVWGLAETVTR